LHRNALEDSTTSKTNDCRQRTVQLGNLATTGALMQAIDILCDRTRQPVKLFKARQGLVRPVWPGMIKSLPANK
jgi:hypothetical protein